jgi:hypothetical protein
MNLFGNTMRSIHIFLTLTLVGLALTQAGCDRERQEFGNEFAEESGKLHLRQASSRAMIAFTDTVLVPPTKNFSKATLGELHDATFGTTAGVFAQTLQPASYDSIVFNDQSRVDSAFFSIRISRGLGSSPLRVRVSQLPRRLSTGDGDMADSLYAGGRIIAEGTVAAGEQLVKLPLAADWVRGFLTGAVGRTQKPSSWTDYFYGVRVEAVRENATDQGRLAVFTAGMPGNGLHLYWHNDQKAGVLEVLSGTKSAGYAALTRNFTGSRIGQLLTEDSAQQNRTGKAYITSGGGARLVIDFSPLVAQWKDSMPLSLNRAELRIPLSADNAAYGDTLISQLHAWTKNGATYTRTEEERKSEAIYDGKYNRNRGYFSLNLTTTMQAVLMGMVPENKLYLFPDNNSNGIGRSVLATPLASGQPMELVLTYTKL